MRDIPAVAFFKLHRVDVGTALAVNESLKAVNVVANSFLTLGAIIARQVDMIADEIINAVHLLV